MLHTGPRKRQRSPACDGDAATRCAAPCAAQGQAARLAPWPRLPLPTWLHLVTQRSRMGPPSPAPEVLAAFRGAPAARFGAWLMRVSEEKGANVWQAAAASCPSSRQAVGRGLLPTNTCVALAVRLDCTLQPWRPTRIHKEAAGAGPAIADSLPPPWQVPGSRSLAGQQQRFALSGMSPCPGLGRLAVQSGLGTGLLWSRASSAGPPHPSASQGSPGLPPTWPSSRPAAGWRHGSLQGRAGLAEALHLLPAPG